MTPSVELKYDQNPKNKKDHFFYAKNVYGVRHPLTNLLSRNNREQSTFLSAFKASYQVFHECYTIPLLIVTRTREELR